MTSSLVTEILSSTGLLDKDSLTLEIQKLNRRIELIKVEVQEALDNCYSSFCPLMIDSINLQNQIDSASKETDSIIDKIENELKPSLQDAMLRSDCITQDIRKTVLMSSIISSLVEIHSGLEEVETARISKKYLEASQRISQIGAKIEAIPFENAKDMKVLQSLKTEQIVKKEQLIHDLNETWERRVLWTLPSSKNPNSCELKIIGKSGAEHFEESQVFILALQSLNHLEYKVKTFGNHLMKHFIRPIVTQSVTFDSELTQSNTLLRIKIINSNKPNADDVCRNLEELFETLSSFLNCQIEEGSESLTMMHILGKHLSEEFCSLVIKQCLEPAVPSESKYLENFTLVLNSVVALDSALQEYGFLNTAESSIIQYAKNHESLFANKICQDILSKAREKMKEDLFVTINIDSPSANLESCVKEQTMKTMDIGFLQNALKFPSCKVSKFVEDILTILTEILEEASRDGSVSATRLYLTARHVCEMFCDVVPVYHSNSITMFPQQTAIHHNNCMYLAHRLLLLGTCFQSRLTADTGHTSTVTFSDLALKLQRLGTEQFLEQMRRQRQQIFDFIQGSGAFHDMGNEAEFSQKAQKAVKQCLLHLTSLHNVWINVLPNEVYLKAMGTLCNSCIEELVLRVINQEDITEIATGHLDFIFQLILDGMPLLFALQNEDDASPMPCQKYIRKWQKFQELKTLLVSNLKGIVDRWASGKGPLADDFSADEVKQLIRALFQNTDRRAKALASIR